MRIREIDVFRGLAIVLMVFFSLLVRLAGQLPDILNHNVPASLHAGDFVLPMFLFASGMSLVFFAEKRARKKTLDYALDVIERAGKLALIWVFLSPFSSGELFGMDELILNVALFLPCAALVRMPDKALAALAIAACALYVALSVTHSLPISGLHYLGGYGAAIFYLPVMLAGMIAGRRVGNIGTLVVPSLAITAVLLLLVPPWKMSAGVSFMALAVLVSLLAFIAIRNVRIGWLEYLGIRPFRYWVLMFTILIIPISIYADLAGNGLPLGIEWPVALFYSLVCIPLLYGISRLMDRFLPLLAI